MTSGLTKKASELVAEMIADGWDVRYFADQYRRDWVFAKIVRTKHGEFVRRGFSADIFRAAELAKEDAGK